jgi:hypothetical protein
MPNRLNSKHIILPVIVLFLLCLSGTIQAGTLSEFSILCQNQRKPDGKENVRVLLELERGVAAGIDYKWVISFRQGHTTLFESTRYLKLEDSIRYFEFWYQLPLGTYTVVAELQQEDTGRPILRTCAFVCRSLGHAVSLSDVTLMDKDGFRPLMKRDIVAYMGILRFSSEVYSKDPGYYTIRAVLYRQDENLYSEDAGKFTSVQQVSQSVYVRNSRYSFSESFQIDENESGNYLVEIFVYQDGKIVSESNYPFYLVWSEIPEMMSAPEKYIKYMRWIHPVMGQDTYSLSGESLRQAFMQFWTRQNDVSEGYQYRAMESYYKQILSTIEVYGGNGWQAPQSKYVSLFGWPDSVRKYTIGIDSILYWQYYKPPLTCYFIKPAGEDTYHELKFREKLRVL